LISIGRLKEQVVSGLKAGQLLATKQVLHWRRDDCWTMDDRNILQNVFAVLVLLDHSLGLETKNR
jgi:hypothetical protein